MISNKIASIILFAGSVEWLMFIIILESFQPNYISAFHYVSSLRVGTTALIFNISIILFGASVVVATIILLKNNGKELYLIFLSLSGIFIIAVGIFPENIRPIHGYATAFAFILAVVSVIPSYRNLNSPFSHVSLVIGILSLILLIIFFPFLGLPAESMNVFLGLGKGTIERMIIYLLLVWVIGLGTYLMNIDKSL